MTSKLADRLLGALLLTIAFIQLPACDSNDAVERFVQAEEVAALDLVSLSVASDVSLLNAGEQAHFTVTGRDSKNNEVTGLDNRVTWKSSDNTLATVNSSGLVTAIADGVVTITASFAYLQADASLTISTAELVQLALNGDMQVDVCKTSELTAEGTYADGSKRPVSAGINWSVQDTTLASIRQNNQDNSATLYTHTPGIVNVKAEKGRITGEVSVEIIDSLQEFVVSPLQVELPAGDTVVLNATGLYADSQTTDITASTIWRSTDSAIAEFDATVNGQLKGIAQGSTVVIGSCGGLSQNVNAVVEKLTLSFIEINFGRSSITLDETDDGYQLTLRATYTDGSVQDVTDDAAWSKLADGNNSDNIIVSNIGRNKGELTITGPGSANIEAEFEGRSETILIIVR